MAIPYERFRTGANDRCWNRAENDDDENDDIADMGQLAQS